MSARHAVCIIVYTPAPTDIELASFKQCLTVLCNHTIIIVCPENADISKYNTITNEHNVNIKIMPFSDKYFTSISSYNTFIKSYEFYIHFQEYDYILIYQLDAWVFRDELDTWCDKEYAYIGAPFYKNGKLTNLVGNGGFSLRNVPTFMQILSGYFDRDCRISNDGSSPLPPSKYMLTPGAEDLQFATIFSLLPQIKNPTPVEAAFFAFQGRLEELHAITGHRLPFGCHAFHKRAAAYFWAQYIPALPQRRIAHCLLRLRKRLRWKITETARRLSGT